MKCFKKFLALGICVGVMSTSTCSAVLPDEVKEFYLSTGIDEVILKSSEGLRAICHFLNGGYGPNLIGQTALESYLSQVHEQAKKNNDDLKSLRHHLAAHLEGIRETAGASFVISAANESCLKAGEGVVAERLLGIANFMVKGLSERKKLLSNFSDADIEVLIKQSAKCFLCDHGIVVGEGKRRCDLRVLYSGVEYKTFVESDRFTIDYVRFLLLKNDFKFPDKVLSKLFGFMKDAKWNVSVSQNISISTFNVIGMTDLDDDFDVIDAE